jgi:hypothetical protein
MMGRRVPWTHEKVLAYLMCNEPRSHGEKKKTKRQAVREDRVYLKYALTLELKE